MRIVSVKYSSPNSVSGRFPEYTRAILVHAFPAYAYAGATAPSLTAGTLGHISIYDREVISMFRRLYDKSESAVNKYLEKGNINSIFYLNSIGSIKILEEINTKAAALGIVQENSPKGCWAKNYAALVIHRREDWAVSVKGFNRFVWDYEASSNENMFGIYQSHGALLVANSEASLKTHDIDNGWDWTRHPGTTTIKMNPSQLITPKYRFET